MNIACACKKPLQKDCAGDLFLDDAKDGRKIGGITDDIAGILVYGISTLLAGFAGSVSFHVVMRGLQGVGKGCVLGNVLACFGEYLNEGDRAKAMGFYRTLTGLIFLLSPVVGGVMGDFIGWRSTLIEAGQ